MPYTDKQNRDAIKTVIAAHASLAVIYPFWVFGRETEDKWPGHLKAENDQGRVHGYVITRRRSRGEIRGNCGARRHSKYIILGFHYYQDRFSAARSEDLFGAEIDAMTAAMDARASLPPQLQRSEPIDWNFDLKSYGGELLHVAIGIWDIDPC